MIPVKSFNAKLHFHLDRLWVFPSMIAPRPPWGNTTVFNWRLIILHLTLNFFPHRSDFWFLISLTLIVWKFSERQHHPSVVFHIIVHLCFLRKNFAPTVRMILRIVKSPLSSIKSGYFLPSLFLNHFPSRATFLLTFFKNIIKEKRKATLLVRYINAYFWRR